MKIYDPLQLKCRFFVDLLNGMDECVRVLYEEMDLIELRGHFCGIYLKRGKKIVKPRLFML